MSDNLGIPSGSIDRIFDFVDDMSAMFLTLVEAFLEVGWTLLIKIFIDLAPAMGLSLVLCFWLYIFYTKFIEGAPR